MKLTPSEAGLTLKWTLIIPFRLVSKSNDKSFNRKTGHHFKAAKFAAFENSVAFLSVATCKRPMLKVAWVCVEPHFKNKAHVDVSNIFKGLLDALKQGGVFEDDKYVGVTVAPIPVYGDENSIVEIWG